MNLHGNSTTWAPGDTVRYHSVSDTLAITPGLYWYSGLGSGTYFAGDGTVHGNLTPQEGNALARAEGLEMRYVDSFARFRPTYVGD